MTWRVLISCVQLQQSIDRYVKVFAEHGIAIDLPDVLQQMDEDQLLQIVDQYDGIVAGDDVITRAVIEKASRLKIIAKWGVGVDNIDLEAARERGIKVVNTPQMFADEVSDVAMGYIILLARGLHLMDASVRAGGWLKIRGTSLRGQTAGVIGLGSIGRAVVRRTVAHGMSPLGHDILAPDTEFQAETGLELTDPDELLSRSDFIVLCCNLTPENRHMLNKPAFGLMKDGVKIVNVARGPLIDEAALIEALDTGKVAGAALDVFEREPLSNDHPIRAFDNCIFGTHNGSNTLEGVLRTNERAINNLLEGLGIEREIPV